MHRSDAALEWNDLEVILAVARAGTLSGAARQLGLNHSTIFRKINAIEERTGVRFFDRLPTGYRTTEAGETALNAAERIETEVHALGRALLGQDASLRGHVRVTAPEGLASLILPAPLADFSRANKGVTLEIVGTAAALDLSRRETEVAIRATRKAPDGAFGRKVCGFNFAVYASPNYLKDREGVPLAQHDWCLLAGVADWLVPAIWKKRAEADERTLLTSSSTIGMVEAAAAGLGLTALPCYVGGGDPRLVRVGGVLEHLRMTLWVLTHPDLRQTARVKALMDFLYEVLLTKRDLFDGSSSP